MSTAVAPLDLAIPLTLTARSFVAHWTGGVVSATSSGTNTRVRRWLLAGDEPAELLTSELNHVVGFAGPLAPGEPASLPPAGLGAVDRAVDARTTWGADAVIRGSREHSIVVLEIVGVRADHWHRIDDAAWVATSAEGLLSAVAVQASPEPIDEITIVFDPTAEVQVDVDNAWISLYFEGDETSEDESSGDGDLDEDESHGAWQDIHVGDFSADRWHVSIGCRTEIPSLEMPVPSGVISEALTLRTAAAGGVISGHVRTGDDIVCVARFRDAPAGEWLEFGSTGLYICRGEGDVLAGFAHRQRHVAHRQHFVAVQDYLDPDASLEDDDLDMPEEPDAPDAQDRPRPSSVNIFVETADGSSVRWQEPSPEELFTRATNIAFTPIGAAPDWEIGAGRILTSDAQWQVEGQASAIRIQHGQEPSGPYVQISSARAEGSPTLIPKLTPEPLRHRAAAWIVQQEVSEPATRSDPDAWRMSPRERLLRNELALRTPRVLDAPVVSGDPIRLEALEGTNCWAAWGELDGVQILVTAREVQIQSMRLSRLHDLEPLRGATLDCIEPPCYPSRPSPDAHSMSAEGLWALNAAEEVAGSIEEWWSSPPGQNDITRLFAPDVAARWGGAEMLRDRLELYRAVSGGLGIRAVDVGPKATPDGLLASGTVVIVRPDADSDPAGSGMGSSFTMDHASQLEYDFDQSNDVRADGVNVEVRLRLRREGSRMLITTDLVAVLSNVYGAPDSAVQPSSWSRPAATPHHRIEVEHWDTRDLADADLHTQGGIASVSSKDPTSVTVNGEAHPISGFERLWQVRWIDEGRLVITGDAGDEVANSVVYDVRSGELIAALDRGPRPDGLVASPRFIATTYSYDDEPGVPHASQQRTQVRDPSGRRASVPRGPIGEGLAAFSLDGEYQLGAASHFGSGNVVDDTYPPPMVFTNEATILLLGDDAVVELDVEHGTRTLHPRPEVGYREAIAARGEWLFILAALDGDGDSDDMMVWEWRLGDEWPTSIGSVARPHPLDGHGTSDGAFVSRRRRDGAGEIIRVIPIE